MKNVNKQNKQIVKCCESIENAIKLINNANSREDAQMWIERFDAGEECLIEGEYGSCMYFM